MKLKSKYSIGEIVLFYNHKTKDVDVGQISKVYMSFSYQAGKEEDYMIAPIRMKASYVSDSMRIDERDIREKLNKKAFKKAYAEQCAKEMINNGEFKS